MYLHERLGQSYTRQGKLKEGLPHVLRARAIAHGPELYLILTILSTTYLKLGDARTAERYALESLQFAEKLKNPRWVRTAYIRIGEAKLALGNDREAEAAFRKVPADEGLDSKRLAYSGLAKVAEKRGHLEEALDWAEKAVATLDERLGLRTEGDQIPMMQAAIEPYRMPLQVLIRLAFENPARRDEFAQRAFQASERIRDRIFVQHLSLARQRSGSGSHSLDQRLKAIERNLTGISKTLLNNNLSPAEEAKLRESFQRLEVDQVSVKREIAIRENRFSRTGQIQEWSVERVQSSLDPDTAFLEFALGEPAAVFVITRGHFEMVPLPSPGSTRNRAAAYTNLMESLDSPNDRFAVASGYALFRDLAASALAALPAKPAHLIVVPDSGIESLPFEALRTDAQGRFLIEDYSVSYLPSAGTLSMVRDGDRAPKAGRLLAFADPVYPRLSDASPIRSFLEGDDFSAAPLPYSRDEVESIGQIVGRGGVDVFTGFDASEERVKSMDLAAYNVLHFASHAVASTVHPDRSALVLALRPDQEEDGFLQVREIYNLRLNADLVVLSACQTAQGNEFFGQGMAGLARAFFFAGARSLVASQWTISDRATAELMAGFYRNLYRGLSKAESLRQAKIDRIRGGHRAPKDWAGLVLLGESEGRIRFESPASARSVLAVSGIAGLIGLLGLACCWALLGKRRNESFRLKPHARGRSI